MVACDHTCNANLPQSAPCHPADGAVAAPVLSSPTPPRSGYRFLAGIVGSVQAHGGLLAEKLDAPHKQGKGGRRGYGAVAKLSAVLLQYILNIRYANRFLAELDANPELLAICGLDQAPDEGTYSRFTKVLTEYEDEFDLVAAKVTLDISDELERLRALGIVPAYAPKLGNYIAFDSTDIEAYGNPKRKVPRDPDATWGHRTPNNKSNSKKDDELFYGFKAHEAVDCYYGLPLAGIVLPANEGDGPQLPNVLAKVRRLHPQMKHKFGAADKAYAGQQRLKHLVEHGIIPVVAIPKPRKDEDGKRLFDGIYTEEGRPTCIGGEPMEYWGYDPDRGHLFRCPGGGCALKHQVHWSTYCDCEVWEKPEGKLLRTIGILPRFTDEWKEIYRMRPAIERYFRSGKHSRLLDRHQYLGIAKVGLRVAIARLTYLATALARLKANDYAGMRHMTVRLPRSQRGDGEPPPGMACQNADCTFHGWWAAAA